ncbi:Uncharacterised protein [Vibrio cholerae]|nr:Uncharacterised protein [Vibrio cholerae]
MQPCLPELRALHTAQPIWWVTIESLAHRCAEYALSSQALRLALTLHAVGHG